MTARVTTLSDAVSSFTRAPAPTHTTAHHQQQSASTSSLNGHKPDTQVTSSSSRSSPAVQARSDQGSQASVTSSVAQAAPSERKGWGTGWVRRKPIQAKSPDRVIEPTQVTTATTTSTAAADQTQQPAAAAAAAAAAASSNGRTVSGATVTEDGAVIVNKRAGRDRPWKRTRDPGERQETVKVRCMCTPMLVHGRLPCTCLLPRLNRMTCVNVHVARPTCVRIICVCVCVSTCVITGGDAPCCSVPQRPGLLCAYRRYSHTV